MDNIYIYQAIKINLDWNGMGAEGPIRAEDTTRFWQEYPALDFMDWPRVAICHWQRGAIVIVFPH